MTMCSDFEMLPDEIILHVCGYLRGVDVLYSFFDLNARLNVTTTGYCRHVNLLAAAYQPLHYVVINLLPRIGSSVRAFVLNGNWKTKMSADAFTVLFGTQLSSVFPQLQRLTLKWFTGEMISSFLDSLENLLQLVKIDIRVLNGKTEDTLLTKILAANNGRLVFVSFDRSSVSLNLLGSDETVSFPNIEELIVEVRLSRFLPCLFTLVPNVRRLHVTLNNEERNRPEFKKAFADMSPFAHLIDFQLRSIDLFWTLDEILDVLYLMPSLQRLALDLCTYDELLVTGETFAVVLPSSLTEIHVFLRYYYPEPNFETDALLASWPNHLPIICLLDEERQRVLLHTVPFNLRSMILPAEIGKQMSSGWKYMQQVDDLYIYNATSLTPNTFPYTTLPWTPTSHH